MEASKPRQQQQPVTRSHKTKLIVFSLLILLIGLTFWVSATLSSLARTRLSSIQDDPFSRSAGSSRILNYCYLTAYPELCFDSVPAFINQKARLPKPGEVVYAAIRAAVHEFKSALPDGVGLPECRSEVERSMSGLNRALAALGIESDLGRLSYEEVDVMIRWIAEAAFIGPGCKREVVDGMESGLRRATQLATIAMGLMTWRDYVVLQFGQERRFYQYIGDGSMVLFYVVMYLLIALLYLLFWDM